MKAYKLLCEQLGYQFLDNSLDYKNRQPIFIHSLWRSGSTYIFKLFRESKQGYYTYQESIHEIILSANTTPKILLDVTSCHLSSVLRHPILGKPYFYELYKTHHLWSTFVSKSMILDNYFSQSLDESMVNYLDALIVGATGRPVFQECRTSNRIGAIKKHLGGIHIYLWRNPWDQWWSFKVHDYFDSVCQIIIGSNTSPLIMRIREMINYHEYHNNDIHEEINYFNHHKLSPKDCYLVYFTLWSLAFLEAQCEANIIISIDELSISTNYQKKILEHFQKLGIYGIDFSNCNVPQAFFDGIDCNFFSEIECQVFKLLLEFGYPSESINNVFHKLKLLRFKLSNLKYSGSFNDNLQHDLRKVRNIILYQ